jgi:hypothetical protein
MEGTIMSIIEDIQRRSAHIHSTVHEFEPTARIGWYWSPGCTLNGPDRA